MSIDYKAYLQSDEWKQKAEAAKKAAGYRCQVCNGRKRLETHHRTYERIGFELPGDLIVMCYKCHGLFHHEETQTVEEIPLPAVIIYHGKSDSAWGIE